MGSGPRRTSATTFVTKFASGEWVGVTLDTDAGVHNGSVMGKSYFECGPKQGIFTDAAKLQVLYDSRASTTCCAGSIEACRRLSRAREGQRSCRSGNSLKKKKQRPQ